MSAFASLPLPKDPTVIAPDGSAVRVLLSTSHGSMAHFELSPGCCSAAVKHKTVEELWYVVGGEAEMWRSQNGREEVVCLKQGMSLSIPLGTSFQFRTVGNKSFAAVAVTMPPWPGQDEAVLVNGPWTAT